MTTPAASSKIVRGLRNGQITIPIEFRRELRVEDNALWKISLSEDGSLRLQPVSTVERTSGSPWIRESYDLFEGVRRQVRESGMTDDEIDRFIDEAIAEARADRSNVQSREE